jgi:hypothetical protein
MDAAFERRGEIVDSNGERGCTAGIVKRTGFALTGGGW